MNPSHVQYFCDAEPYYGRSHEYFMDHVWDNYKVSYWEWMITEHRTVLLNRMGSYSDTPDQQWGFVYERDMTWFKLRWGGA